MPGPPKGTAQTGLCHGDLLREGKKTTEGLERLKWRLEQGSREKRVSGFSFGVTWGTQEDRSRAEDYLIPLEAMGPIS